MAAVRVEGISDRIAVEAAARRLGRSLVGVEIVPIGGAQAIGRAFAQCEGERVVGLCDAGEERWFHHALGDSVFVCVENLEDELIRALGAARVEKVLAAQGDLETFRNVENQLAWRGRPVEAQLRRRLHAADRRASRYPPLLLAAVEPERIPRPLAGLLAAVGREGRAL